VADDDLLAERLLRVVDEGRRTATYKLALLIGLIDGAALAPGEPEIPTRVLAERIVEIYYPQTRVYIANDGTAHALRQISMKQSTPLQAVLRLRLDAEAGGWRTLDEVRRRLPDSYERTLSQVEETFVRYPIPLLQVVGNRLVPFLYEVGWREGTSVSLLRRQGRDRLRFLDRVPDRLVVLGPLLRPLIELHWTRDVARWSGVCTEEDRLRAHLFGASRAAFPAALRTALCDLQRGRCFYCDGPLARGGQIDHFLAWSRWPNHAVENLVVADTSNGDKSDHLPWSSHVDRWVDRLRSDRDTLAGIAGASGWTSDLQRSRALVRTTYLHVARGTPLWVRGKEFVEADGPFDVPV
jgi:hypothetical protein